MSAQPTPDTADIALERFLRQETDQHRQALDALLGGLAAPFGRMLAIWERAVRAGGKLLLFGNGGSAADAQHIAAELVIRYEVTRPAIAAIALSTDSSALTAGANDFGFETVFSRQVEALGRPGDVAVAISTSGRSPNVLAGLREARARGLSTTGLTGAGGTGLCELCDAAIEVPSGVTARIQELHILLGHMLCKALEQRLGQRP
jgi:D-sedoheptulose 7-phosphate isomerase